MMKNTESNVIIRWPLAQRQSLGRSSDQRGLNQTKGKESLREAVPPGSEQMEAAMTVWSCDQGEEAWGQTEEQCNPRDSTELPSI